MQSSTHTHDVQVFWNFWPFTVIFPNVVKQFLDGHGLNPISDILNEMVYFWEYEWNNYMPWVFSAEDAAFRSWGAGWIDFFLWFPNAIIFGFLDGIHAQLIRFFKPFWGFYHAIEVELYLTIILGGAGAALYGPLMSLFESPDLLAAPTA